MGRGPQPSKMCAHSKDDMGRGVSTKQVKKQSQKGFQAWPFQHCRGGTGMRRQSSALPLPN